MNLKYKIKLIILDISGTIIDHGSLVTVNTFIKVFNKRCLTQSNCTVSEKKGNLIIELKEKILKTAAIYVSENEKNKKSKPYMGKQ